MTNLNLRSSGLPDNHLSPEEMYDYIENKLPATARYEVEAHLLECDLCTEALDGIALAPKDQTFPNLLEINKRIKTRTTRRKKNNTLSHIKNWGLATGVIFLVIFAAIMVWFEARRATYPMNTSPKTSENKPDKAAEPVIGFAAYQKYIAESLRKSDKIKVDQNIIVSFTVNPDGRLSEFSAAPIPGNQSPEKAINIIKNGPAWKPAQKADKNISQKVSVTVPANR